ncbi:hypothetical protein N7462_011246 [Penicillium macrosclerotiorum]|uniref:uncharacterized protein n=1 Tax=Penicillium macrosclerotiorum TaxID=303699 RepID=UPI0025473EC2|nr:uncharacterized protein N7462_011246 [Penicillium macrosclerotiorum]KAJ5666837.1 hypothetical protein N7462_011246 [Penicillium macrosclerotiorum]
MSSSDHDALAMGEISSRPSTYESTEIEQPTLAPADGGKAAWLLLASCCIIQLPVWGVPQSTNIADLNNH